MQSTKQCTISNTFPSCYHIFTLILPPQLPFILPPQLPISVVYSPFILPAHYTYIIMISTVTLHRITFTLFYPSFYYNNSNLHIVILHFLFVLNSQFPLILPPQLPFIKTPHLLYALFVTFKLPFIQDASTFALHITSTITFYIHNYIISTSLWCHNGDWFLRIGRKHAIWIG